MKTLWVALLLWLAACSAFAQMAMYTATNAGTTSAAHAVVAATGLGHKFYSAICSGNSAFSGGYCMVFDAATQPVDGAVTACPQSGTAASCLKFCAAIPAGPGASQGIAVAGGDMASSFQNGIVVVTSTGANCLTLATGEGATVIETVNYN